MRKRIEIILTEREFGFLRNARDTLDDLEVLLEDVNYEYQEIVKKTSDLLTYITNEVIDNCE